VQFGGALLHAPDGLSDAAVVAVPQRAGHGRRLPGLAHGARAASPPPRFRPHDQARANRVQVDVSADLQEVPPRCRGTRFSAAVPCKYSKCPDALKAMPNT